MSRYLPLALTIGLLVACRAVGNAFPEVLPNFQPLGALFFCGALLAPSWRGLAIPSAIWAGTYFLFGVGAVYDMPTFVTTILSFTVTFFLGKALMQRGVLALLLGSIVSAVIFHLLTNTAAWLGSPMYAKTLTGFWQSVWTGPPGAAIANWEFLRNMAAANVLFTGIFLAAQLRLPKATEAPVSTAPVSAK